MEAVAGFSRSSSVWPLPIEDPGQGGLYAHPSASELQSLTSVISKSESDSASCFPSGGSALSLLAPPAPARSPLRGIGWEVRPVQSLGTPGRRVADLSKDSPGIREMGGGSWDRELG